MKTSPLSAVATAEAALIRSIDAATATVTTIGTNAVDAALAKLDAAAVACHARLTHAMTRLYSTVAEIAGTMEALAEGIMDDLSTEEHLDRYGDAHRQASEPAPQFGKLTNSPLTTPAEPSTSHFGKLEPSTVPATSEPEPDAPSCDDDGITFTEADFAEADFAAIRKRQSAALNNAHAQESPKMPRQAPQASETTPEPSEVPIETPRGSLAAGTIVSVQAIAACGPVPQDRDDRQPATSTPPRKPRRRKAS